MLSSKYVNKVYQCKKMNVFKDKGLTGVCLFVNLIIRFMDNNTTNPMNPPAPMPPVDGGVAPTPSPMQDPVVPPMPEPVAPAPEPMTPPSPAPVDPTPAPMPGAPEPTAPVENPGTDNNGGTTPPPAPGM